MIFRSFGYPRHFFLVCLTIFALHVSGQENPEPARLVTAAGDTLHGYINNLQWAGSPDKVSFQATPGAPWQIFNPMDLQAFSFTDGDHYVTKTVTYHFLPANLNTYEIYKDTVHLRKTLLLRVLASGPASLYYFRDENGYDHFFIEKDSLPIDELKKTHSVMNGSDGRQYSVKENRYMLSLNYYFSDCPDVVSRIQGVSFTISGFQKIFERYNLCKDPLHKVPKKKETYTKVAWGAFGGLTLTHLNVSSDIYPDLNDADFPLSTDLTGGLFLDLVFARNLHRTRWSNEISYKKYSTEATYDNYMYAAKTYDEVLSVSASYLRFSTMLDYDLTISKAARPYLKLGISSGWALHIDNVRTLDPPYYGTSEFPILEHPNKHEESIFLGVGLRSGRLKYEIRHEWATGISTVNNISMSTNSFSFLLGYSLGVPSWK